MQDSPLVTIGMPIFNAAETIKYAVESLVSQTHSNIEIIISDNCSTDATPQICKELESKDSRIAYSRNEQNLGADRNFEKVLALATGKYFMWASDDDFWSPNFVETLVNSLEKNELAIGAITPIGKIDSGRVLSSENPDIYNISGRNPIDRILSVSTKDYGVSIFSLFRLKSIK